MFAYEKIKVYEKAYTANRKIYRLLKVHRTMTVYAKNQLGKAGLSVMLNIAEGSAKFRKKDRRNFFIIARGSAFECASLLCFLNDEGEIDNQTKEELYLQYEGISRMLFAMINNLND